MKRLTINRIACAGLSANRRGYFSLAAGLFLSIFLVSGLCFCIQGLILARQEQIAQKMGYEDCLLMNDSSTDGEMRESGLFDRIGHVYVTGYVIEDDKYLGYYDEEGAALLNRRLLEGRMPEQAGEIALERSVLEALRVEKALGDQLTLAVTPIDGRPEERTFTITGFLAEQTQYLDASRTFQTRYGTVALPAILTFPQEPPYATGRLVTHRLATLARFVTPLQLSSYANSGERNWTLFFVGDGQMQYEWADYGSELSESVILLSLLGAALLICACVGIAGAMESQLARKTEEIGMLRAVGATRRQIRRIFGREAWLLALALAPVSAGCGCLFAWGLSCLAPEQFIFRPSPFLLLPILLLSVVCILMSASLPLRRASRVMPMGVLRDTALLRRSRRVRSPKRFRVERLIAWRQNLLHPTRPLGEALLLGLMLFCVGLCVAAVYNSGIALYENKPDILLSQDSYWESTHFANNMSERALTESDLAQIRALPYVERMEVTRWLRVNLVLDEAPDYWREAAIRFGADQYQYLLSEDEYRRSEALRSERLADRAKHTEAEVNLRDWLYGVEEYNAVRDALELGRDKALLPLTLRICEVDGLEDYVVEGRIDRAALDAGRAVLVYAPTLYEVQSSRGDIWHSHRLTSNVKELSRLECDAFSAGESLSLLELCDEQGEVEGSFLRRYGAMESIWGETTVGAVLQGDVDGVWEPSLITTPRGAVALGLRPRLLEAAKVYLQDGVGEEEEAYVEQRIEAIAARGENVTVRNYRQLERDGRDLQRRLVWVLATISVVFFAVAIAMITGSVGRQVRTDTRMIGTLRAVGADGRVIAGCYGMRVTLSVALGTLLGVIGWAVILRLTLFSARMALFMALAEAAFALASLSLCHAMLRLRVREILARSVVENIREL